MDRGWAGNDAGHGERAHAERRPAPRRQVPAIQPALPAAEPVAKPIARARPPVESGHSLTRASYRHRDIE
jgi:hypothetical protein